MIFRSVNQPDNSVHSGSPRAAKWTETKKTRRQRSSYPVLSAAAQCLGLEPRAVIRLQRRRGFIQTKATQLAEGDEETDCLPLKYGLTNGCLKHGVGIFKPQRLGFIYRSVPYPKPKFQKVRRGDLITATAGDGFLKRQVPFLPRGQTVIYTMDPKELEFLPKVCGKGEAEAWWQPGVPCRTWEMSHGSGNTR